MSTKEIVEKIVGPVIAGYWSHLHISRYAIFKLEEIQRKPHIYYKEEDFWKDLIGPKFYLGGVRKLRLGDIVELRNFQLTEWFPRSPGTYWTKESVQLRERAQEDIEGRIGDYLVYGPQGKYKMVTGGVGTNRILTHETHDDKYRILCATSSGLCDAGIPIVVLGDVCSKIEEPITENCGIEVDLKGKLVELPFAEKEIIIPARGAEIDEKLKDWLSTTLHIPRYFVLVESSLQVKKYISDFRLRASAWTLFAREVHEGITPSFTYATFDPRKADSLEKAADFIARYVLDHQGKTIYTDFDEHVRRLNSKYRIDEVITKQYDDEMAREDLKTLLKWGRTVEDIYCQPS